MEILRNKTVILGVTGGIAAYKSALLTRLLVKKGCVVKVVMTENAKEFVTPLTFQTLSGNQVFCETFSLIEDWEIGHITLAESADLIVLAPATANIIGKITAGIADDLLSTTVMASKSPVLVCPAMNTAMYDNRIVQRNLNELIDHGYEVMDASSGELACKVIGKGRMPEPEDIVERIENILTPKDLNGYKMLITAGPTLEPMDPVRFISNHSSGKMGYALAENASRRGADVTLISGPTALRKPSDVKLINVTTANDMRREVLDNMEGSTVIIKAAAVADFRPAEFSSSKIKKKNKKTTIELQRNPDIIKELGEKKEGRILVGFAMETEDLVNNAVKKMNEKNMDMIVANDLSMEGSGFGHDTNIVKIIKRSGDVEALPLMEKREVAWMILERIKRMVDERNGQA